jgi:hypothetical protein
MPQRGALGALKGADRAGHLVERRSDRERRIGARDLRGNPKNQVGDPSISSSVTVFSVSSRAGGLGNSTT